MTEKTYKITESEINDILDYLKKHSILSVKKALKELEEINNETRDVILRLDQYVGCQRTDLQPIFMSRLKKLINELKESMENEPRKNNRNKG